MIFSIGSGRDREFWCLVRCILSRFKHFLTGMLVYKLSTSILAKRLLDILIFFKRLRRSPEFFMWEGLIVPRRGVRWEVIALAMRCGALSIPEVIGLMGMLAL